MEKLPTFTVFQLTAGIQNLLGTVFSQVRVSGEISDLKQSGMGHCYFLLKDPSAQLSAVLWNSRRPRGLELHDGMEVVCEGKIEVYPPRGNYQLVVSSVEAKGLGQLEKEFLVLKQKLTEEGLFDPQHKKPLPHKIRRVGVVTSPSGAAIHDFLQVLKRRWCGVDVCIFPSPVQGDGAAEKLAEGISFFNRHASRLGIDCIVLTRGGGSMEDLWEFNREKLVRAVYDSELPIISGVGHEIDVTLCDLAADRRALTPSEAAEIISPNVQELSERLRSMEDRLARAIRDQMNDLTAEVGHLENSPVFRFPHRKFEEWTQRLDSVEERLQFLIQNQFRIMETEMQAQAARLETLSPLHVLGRGYSVTQKMDGTVIRACEDAAVGERIRTRLSSGSFESIVTEIPHAD